MEELHKILRKNNYKKINLKLTKTNHLLVKVMLNGVKGNFILDTGASNSCVGFEGVEKFNLTAGNSTTKAAGAGATDMETQHSSSNFLQLGRWKNPDFDIVIFDLSHVNLALKQHKTKPVDGIIGADVLIEGKAIIEYENCSFWLG